MNSNARNLGGICTDSITFSCDAELTSPVGGSGTNSATEKPVIQKGSQIVQTGSYRVFFWCGGTQFFLANQRRSEVPVVMQNCISCNCKSKAGEVQIRVISWLPVVSRDYNCSY